MARDAVAFKGSKYRDVEYSPLKRTSEGREPRYFKLLVVVLVVFCVVLMCFAGYSLGFVGSTGPQHTTLPAVNGTTLAFLLEGIGKQVVEGKSSANTTEAQATSLSGGTREQVVEGKSSANTTEAQATSLSGGTREQVGEGNGGSNSTEAVTTPLLGDTGGKVTEGTNTTEAVTTPVTGDAGDEATEKANKTEAGTHTEDVKTTDEENRTLSVFPGKDDLSTTPEQESKSHDDDDEEEDKPGLKTKQDTSVNTTNAHIRDILIQRMKTVVDKLRRGEGHKKYLQSDLHVIQQNLQILDRMNSTRESRKQGQTKPLESPAVRYMMEIFKNSPKIIDMYDFTKSLFWDFRCLFKHFNVNPEPQICINYSEFDDLQLKSLSKTGTWENRMLKLYIEILKSDRSLQAVDLGINIGVFSIIAAALGRPVLALEPNQNYILPFHKSVTQNGFRKLVTLVTNFLSDHYSLGQIIYDKYGNLRDTKNVDVTEELLNKGVMNPDDVIRSVTMNDLLAGMKYPKAILKLHLHGDEEVVFKKADNFFYWVDVRFVLMPWKYNNNPSAYDFITHFFTSRNYIPAKALHERRITDIGLKRNRDFIVWIKLHSSGV